MQPRLDIDFGAELLNQLRATAKASNVKPGAFVRELVRDGLRQRSEPAFVLRAGDTVAVLDGANTTIATASLIAGALRLTSDDGRTLTIILSE